MGIGSGRPTHLSQSALFGFCLGTLVNLLEAAAAEAPWRGALTETATVVESGMSTENAAKEAALEVAANTKPRSVVSSVEVRLIQLLIGVTLVGLMIWLKGRDRGAEEEGKKNGAPVRKGMPLSRSLCAEHHGSRFEWMSV